MAGGNVNRVAYDFASLEVDPSIKGGPSLGVVPGQVTIEYNDKFDRTKMFGSGRYADDATDGVYDADGSWELHRWQYQWLVAQIKLNGLGFYEVEFDLSVSYAHKGEPLHTDTITGVQFADRKHSGKQGPDPLTIPISLFIKGKIFIDSIGPLGETLG